MKDEINLEGRQLAIHSSIYQFQLDCLYTVDSFGFMDLDPELFL